MRPKTLFIDIDGVLLYHYNEGIHKQTHSYLIGGTLDKLVEWDSKGYNIILTTGRRKSQRQETEKQLSELEIIYDQLIMGIGGGDRVVINDRKPNSDMDTAYAINLDRNEGIKDIELDTVNDLINKALNDYKDDIDAKKPNELSISNYTVTKPWGHEQWLTLNKHYAYKLIHMKAGNQSSLQSHKYKYETNYIIKGEAEVLLENDTDELESNIFTVGQGWSVPIGRKHRVIANTDYTALEVSTPHLNDVIRYEDDTDRTSGKIKGEHEV